MNQDAISSRDFSGARVLEVDYAGWRRRITIIDPSTQQVIYTLKGYGWRVPYEITNASGQHIGTTKTSSMTSKITVEMTGKHGEPVAFEIRNDKLIGMVGSPQYTSSVFDGQTMTWKNTAMSKNVIYTLIEGKGMALARFESDRKTMIGKLEIVDTELDETRMNEIAVVLLTLVKRKMKAIAAANSSSYAASLT